MKSRIDAAVQRFAARHGTLLCRDLLGCALSTEEGRALNKAQKG